MTTFVPGCLAVQRRPVTYAPLLTRNEGFFAGPPTDLPQRKQHFL
jgi:hypothetical protein